MNLFKMNNNISTLLFYPFEKGLLEHPDMQSKTLFWNLQYCPQVDDFGNRDVIQSFKPDADIWQGQGVKIYPQFSGPDLYKNIFVVLPKQKELALYMMAQSLQNLEDEGLFMAVAANDAGGKNIEKWLMEMGVTSYSASKNKCRIVWGHRKNIKQDVVNTYIKNGLVQKINIDGNEYYTKLGIYGWNKIDKGSKLLIENLNDDLKGVGADFGCGYGYLSNAILNKCKNIEKLYVLEGDYNALQCAKENLTTQHSDENIEFNWIDLTKPLSTIKNLDWVIMNPPFHEGKKINIDVGQNFILQSANVLKKNGALYMVSNVHLPYEKILQNSFLKIEKICEKDGYKVYRCIK